MLPVEGLHHQRHYTGAASAKQNGVNGYAFGVLPLRRNHRTLARGGCKPRVRMSCLAPGDRSPRPPQPVEQFGRLFSVMLSHQMSPSSVRAQLVKIEFLAAVSMALR